MKLKICGMKYTDNIREVIKLNPDFMGFIFYPQSKRFVGENFIIPLIPLTIKKVGVFVNDSEENILQKVREHKLDYIQLHGDESTEICKNLTDSVKIIKAFGIDNSFDFSVLNDYFEFCDYFLFDTKIIHYGGSGKKFDRVILKKYSLQKQFFLSGGVGIDEISDIKNQIPECFAIDVNSKFEIEPGIKDYNKLKHFKDELYR